MNKILKNITLLSAMGILLGCGGNNNGQTFVVDAPTPPVSYKVAGTVVDGPIYGALVKIVDVKDNSIVYGTTKTDENGAFTIDISGLPKLYKVLIQDGKDAGVDTQVDANDKNTSFRMSATVKRAENNETNTSVANVSPASTLVDKIVETGEMPLEDAQKSVAQSFGMDSNISFSKLDMRKNTVANKISNLIALFTSIAPIDNKDVVLKALANMLKNKDINISVTNLGTNINDFNLTKLFDNIKKLDANNMSENDGEKILKIEALVKVKLVNLLSKIKVATSINDEEKRDALSSKLALDSLMGEIKTLTSDEINQDELKLLMDNMQEITKAFLDDSKNLDMSSPDNIDFLQGLTKENLNLNISDIKVYIIKASKDYRELTKTISSHRVKSIIKSIYKHISIKKYQNIKKLLATPEVLDEVSQTATAIEKESNNIVETGEIPLELAKTLEDTVAGELANKIDNNASNFNRKTIQEARVNIVQNTTLINTFKKNIKIKVKLKAKKAKLTKAEKRDFLAVKQVINTVKVNVKIKKFTQVSADSADNYYKTIQSLQDKTASLQELIDSLKLTIVDLKKPFDKAKFESTRQASVNIIKRVQTTNNYDSVKSINNIKIEIENNFIAKPNNNIADIITQVDNKFDTLVKPIQIKKRILSLPQPRLENAPKEFSTPIKVEI